jgi:hypothetical protein
MEIKTFLSLNCPECNEGNLEIKKVAKSNAPLSLLLGTSDCYHNNLQI